MPIRLPQDAVASIKEAESDETVSIPDGLVPGQVFTVQTSIGEVQLAVPPDGQPGQRIRFPVPQGLLSPKSLLSGSPLGPRLVGMASTPYQVSMGPAETARSPKVRTSPSVATAQSVALLQGDPRAEAKLAVIHRGAAAAETQPMFPARRQCADACWAVAFLIVAAGMVAAAAYFSQRLEADFQNAMEGETTTAMPDEYPSAGEIVAPGALGCAAALVGAASYMAAVRYAPCCTVWISLVLAPALAAAAGVALVLVGNHALGAVVITLGLLFLACIFTCWLPYIPFTIVLVETVAEVIKETPMMVGVGLLGSLAGGAWSLVCGIVYIGGYYAFAGELNEDGQLAAMFLSPLIFIWGHQVADNICHTTYCGVFGRWYCSVGEAPLRKSLAVALTTSFGSICFGSLFIAVLRAVEFVVRSTRRVMEDGQDQCVCCCVLCCVECCCVCFTGIMEYFTGWAYVQCAVRGTGFVDSARISYSWMMCSNAMYIVSALLTDQVVYAGTLLCAVVGGAAGALAGLVFANGNAALAGGVIGAFAGATAGAAATGIISSGVKTVLTLWAECPEKLSKTHPDIHEKLERKVGNQICIDEFDPALQPSRGAPPAAAPSPAPREP